MPESKPTKPIDELLVQRHVAELVHRAREIEMVAATLIAAARFIAAGTLENDAALDKSLADFRGDVFLQRSQMRAAAQVSAMIERARGGGHAH